MVEASQILASKEEKIKITENRKEAQLKFLSLGLS